MKVAHTQINVPIPQNPTQYQSGDPRPQEAGAYAGNDLEHELQNGSEGRMRR